MVLLWGQQRSREIGIFSTNSAFIISGELIRGAWLSNSSDLPALGPIFLYHKKEAQGLGIPLLAVNRFSHVEVKQQGDL